MVGVRLAVGLPGPVIAGMAGAVVSMRNRKPVLQAPNAPALLPARTQKTYCPRGMGSAGIYEVAATVWRITWLWPVVRLSAHKSYWVAPALASQVNSGVVLVPVAGPVNV